MRLLLRAIAALPILLLCVVVVAVVMAPRLISSDAVREELVSIVSAAVGRQVRYDELELQLMPLSVVFVNPSIAGDDPSTKQPGR